MIPLVFVRFSVFMQYYFPFLGNISYMNKFSQSNDIFLRKFISISIEDFVLFWSNYWLHVGRLIDITGKLTTRQLGLRMVATVTVALEGSSCRLHNWREISLQSLVTLICVAPTNW